MATNPVPESKDMSTSLYTQEVLDAIAEAKGISHDPSVPGYTNMGDLKRALEE